MKSGGFVFDELERKADRWRAQYEHRPASVTKERNNRREERKRKKNGFSIDAEAKLVANNAPFLGIIWRYILPHHYALFRSDNPDPRSRCSSISFHFSIASTPGSPKEVILKLAPADTKTLQWKSNQTERVRGKKRRWKVAGNWDRPARLSERTLFETSI